MMITAKSQRGSSISVQHWFLRDAARPDSQEALNRALTRLDRISEPDEVPTRGRFNRRLASNVYCTEMEDR